MLSEKTKLLISVRRSTDKVPRKRIERMKGIAYRSMNAVYESLRSDEAHNIRWFPNRRAVD